MRLFAARVFVRDLAAARRFYGKDLGLSCRVEDAATTYCGLLARGATLIEPPSLQRWGGVLATLQDPSGNALQIVQAPMAAMPV